MEKYTLPTPDQNNRSLFHVLVEDELKFCCPYSFLRETKNYSALGVGKALGMSGNTIRYWRTKKFNGQVVACSSCRLPQPTLQLRKKNKRHYFKRINPARPLYKS